MDNLLKLQYRLIYLYAFLISFEHILEYLYQLETIFKPYRVVGLVIIVNGLFLLKYYRKKIDVSEYFFLALYVYSFLFTLLLALLGEPINQAGFWNDITQIALNALIFIFMRGLLYTESIFINVLKSYILGITINSLIIVLTYYSGSNYYGRESGFSDDPNIASFGILIGLVILFLYRINPNARGKMTFTKNFFLFVFLVLLYVATLLATGSRAGLILIITLFALIAMFSTIFKTLSARNIILVVLLLGFGSSFFKSESVDVFVDQNAAFRRIEQADDDVRWVLWKSGIDVVKDSDYLGIGLAQYRSNWDIFSTYIGRYSKAVLEHRRESKKGLSLHNLYIETLTDVGLIGFVMLMLFFVGKFRKLYFSPKSMYRGIALITLILLAINSMSVRGILAGYIWFSIWLIGEGYFMSERVLKGIESVSKRDIDKDNSRIIKVG